MICQAGHPRIITVQPLEHSVTRAIAGLVLTAAGAGVFLAAQASPPALRTFEDDSPGGPPKGFVLTETRDLSPSRWMVRRDGEGQVLEHVAASAAGPGSALAILDGPRYTTARASVRLKLVDRRSAGLVWRYQDAENYHVAWLNLAEQQVGVYRFTQGNRVRIRSAEGLDLDPAAWHTLRIIVEEDEVEVFLGGIRVFEIQDRRVKGGTPMSVGEAGRVGVWSVGDSAAYFDDLRVEEYVDQPRR
jgi:hypothetical protein